MFFFNLKEQKFQVFLKDTETGIRFAEITYDFISNERGNSYGVSAKVPLGYRFWYFMKYNPVVAGGLCLTGLVAGISGLNEVRKKTKR